MFLILEDGAVFEGRSVSDARECAGLLSFYTGVVGYQQVITDPANAGKIVLFTYPLIGSYGVNGEDAESDAPKVAGAICKEYMPYYSNFRAEGSLKDYLEQNRTSGSGSVVFGQGFDTRAIMLHLRENGEMKAVLTAEKPDERELARRVAAIDYPDYDPENRPEPCSNTRVRAAIMDLGASRSFLRHLAAIGVEDGLGPNEADLIIVSNAPHYLVEDSAVLSQVSGWIGKKPVIGFGHGAAIVARACGGHVRWLKFGDHGMNVPVRHLGGGRNEITIQNHNYEILPGGAIEPLFENVHDGTCEGFKCPSSRSAGANFLPDEKWFELLLGAVGVA